MIDFIGDIHGHADKLEALLKRLNYSFKNGCYSHPDRKALFIGDYIDRGPKIKETLNIVRRMVEGEHAIALMGNHEYNALCFHFQESEGGHLRKHEIKNIIQHYETLKQFQNRQAAYEEYLEWFKTLPLFYETENFRAVHACWHPKFIKFLHENLSNDRLTDELIYQSVKKGTILSRAVNITLKGRELKMPEGLSFTDKDGTMRKEIRIKWWEDPSKLTYKQISVEALEYLPEEPVDLSLFKDLEFYSETEKPVFFGHYWLNGTPGLFRENVCCLDYSVARHGHLAAYRFDNEEKLENNKLIYV